MKTFVSLLAIGLLATAATFVSVPKANAETFYNAYGIEYGNICQTPTGWQRVRYRPVGSTCWSTLWGQWGVILEA